MKKIICCFIISLSMYSATLYAQNTQMDVFKALFMYNFAKNTEWPVSYRKGDFVIGVLGNSSIIMELNKLAKKKKVGSQNIVVKRFSSPEKIEKCHILYIPPNKSGMLASVLKQTDKKPVLLIGDKAGLASNGVLINYITVKGAPKYEINTANFKSRELNPGITLIKLGINVQ